VDFVFDLTIPENTSQSAPVEQEIELPEGVIHHVDVGFPRGCAGLAHVIVRRGAHQVWPSNPDGSYHWDSFVYALREHYPVERGEAPLVLVGWNDDDTFPHTITFRFSVLPVEIMEPWRVQQGILDHLLQLLGIRSKKGRK